MTEFVAVEVPAGAPVTAAQFPIGACPVNGCAGGYIRADDPAGGTPRIECDVCGVRYNLTAVLSPHGKIPTARPEPSAPPPAKPVTSRPSPPGGRVDCLTVEILGCPRCASALHADRQPHDRNPDSAAQTAGRLYCPDCRVVFELTVRLIRSGRARSGAAA